MIKLKKLLSESKGPVWIGNKWFPAHTQSTLTNLKYGDKIALYPKIHEKMFGKIPISSFHVTNPNNLNSLTRILGKKKSLSTFTRANHDSPLAKGRGIQTGSGGVIFYLQGTMLVRDYMDLETVPDKTGRRWTQAHRLTDGDRMIFKTAAKKAGIPDGDEWQKIEWGIHDEHPIENYDNYKEAEMARKEAAGKEAAKVIKKFFDFQNKWLNKNKEKIKKILRTPDNKPSGWWNEILIYNPQVIDVFVLKRVWDDYYFQHDSGFEDRKKLSHEKELLKYVDENKITIGTPAKFRKWYKEREGIIDQV